MLPLRDMCRALMRADPFITKKRLCITSSMSGMAHQDNTVPLGLRLTQGRSSDDDDDDDGEIWFGAAPSRSSYLHAHAADANSAELCDGEAHSQGQQRQSRHFRDTVPQVAIASSSSAVSLPAVAEEEAHHSRSRKRKSAVMAQMNCLELCRSVAKREFVLSDADLSALAYKERPNPVRAHFAPMQVYDRAALRDAALAVCSTPRGAFNQCGVSLFVGFLLYF